MARLSYKYRTYSTLNFGLFNYNYLFTPEDCSPHIGGQGSGQQPSSLSPLVPVAITAPNRMDVTKKIFCQSFIMDLAPHFAAMRGIYRESKNRSATIRLLFRSHVLSPSSKGTIFAFCSSWESLGSGVAGVKPQNVGAHRLWWE